MSAGVELCKLLDAARVARMRRAGALVLDVDDTLLARERAGVGGVAGVGVVGGVDVVGDVHVGGDVGGVDAGGDVGGVDVSDVDVGDVGVVGVGVGGGEETFAESAAAKKLPQLLRRGFRVGLITGHGWRQLETRLVAPIVESLRETGDASSVERLRIYANRGATKIVWDGERHTVDEVYGERHQLRGADVAALRGLLESLGAEFGASVLARGEWYGETFPRFDFTTLPARVDEREGAVLVLRPLPARRHAADGASSARAEVYERGLRLLRGANLEGDYELAESGRSSIEITRRGVSKETAMRDLLAEVSRATGEDAEMVEGAFAYVGDEFHAGGNDASIPLVFPRALCLSVAPGGRGAGEPQAGVVSLAGAADLAGARGTVATHALLSHLLNLSASV